ncbi:MAG: hypothetical protein FWB96_02620 [Defluviitaleaceae bacterium]|nr:hypothetical protein [Defluviitaleaceae bacterium]MCL2263861.1 hypothetical protein [Defluviitaleaceae bacterium]
MEKPTYVPIDMEKIKNKKCTFISSEEALKDVIPIEWSDEVANGDKRVLLVSKN